MEGNFWERILALIRELPQTHLLTFVVGLTTLGLMIFLERRFHRIPAALVALIYGILVVSIFGLEAGGVEIVGEIPAGLAPPQLPAITLDDLRSLIPGALAITLVMFAEAVGPARSFAGKHRYEINEDQELIGLGAANMGAGLFQGFSIGASLSKSAASDAAGGRSQMSAIVAAIATALVALFLTPLFFNLPEAALGAIVIIAVSGMFRPQKFRHLYRLRRMDFWLAMIAFLGVLTFEEVLYGLLIAVIASLLALVVRISQPNLTVLGRIPGTFQLRNVNTHPETVQIQGYLTIRLDEELFFANAAGLRKAIRTELMADDRDIHAIVLDLESSNELDVPGAEMLIELQEELERLDIRLILTGLHAPVQQMLDRSGTTERIGAEYCFPTLTDAFLAIATDEVDHLTTDEMATVINRIDTLAEIIYTASERADEENKVKLKGVLKRLKEIRDHLDIRQ